MSAVLNQAALALPTNAREKEIKSILKKIKNAGRSTELYFLAEHPDIKLMKTKPKEVVVKNYQVHEHFPSSITNVKQLGAGEGVDVNLTTIMARADGGHKFTAKDDGVAVEICSTHYDGTVLHIPYEAIYAITPMFTGYVLPFRKVVLEKLPLPA